MKIDRVIFIFFMFLLSVFVVSQTTQTSPVDEMIKGVIAINSSDPEKSTGMGSGFFIDENKVITNAHVVNGIIKSGAKMEIMAEETYRGYPVELVSQDEVSDIAVLSMTPLLWEEFKKNEKYTILKMNENDWSVSPGLDVYAIGHPEGLMWSVSEGIISGTNRIRADLIQNSSRPIIQSDVNIYHGNSGGPLIDAKTGKVVGINQMFKSMRSGGTVSFSIPAQFAMRIVNDLTDEDKVVKWAVLGLQLTYGENRAPTVEVLVPDKPAIKSGLIVGDVILSASAKLNGITEKKIPIKKPEDLFHFLGYMKAGDTLNLTVKRGNDVKSISILTDGILSSEY